MAYRVLYSQNDLENVAGGATLPAAPVGTLSACSLKIINQSQFGLNLKTSSLHVDHVPPYSWITLPKGMFNDISVEIDTSISVPTLQPNSFVSATTINGVVMYAVGSVFQPNQDTNITGSTGTIDTSVSGNVTTLSQKVNQDPSSGALPAVQSSVLFTFTNPVHYIEFWNIDKQGRDIWLNFNQPTQGGRTNQDFLLQSDPNLKGFGAYYPVTATASGINGFYYEGGQGQVMGWY